MVPLSTEWWAMCRNRYRSAAKRVGECEGIGGAGLASFPSTSAAVDGSGFASEVACVAPGPRLWGAAGAFEWFADLAGCVLLAVWDAGRCCIGGGG